MEKKNATKTSTKKATATVTKAPVKTETKIPATVVAKASAPVAIKENVNDFKAGISAGATIRNCFIAALTNNIINDSAMKVLTDTEQTKKVLGIRYAFLLEVKTGNKEERMIKGNARYTAKPIVEYKGKKYYITNDLYVRNITKFKDWIKSLKENKVDVHKVENKK